MVSVSVPPALTFSNTAFCPHIVIYVLLMIFAISSHHFPQAGHTQGKAVA